MTMDTMTTSMVTVDTELGRSAVRWSETGITRGAAGTAGSQDGLPRIGVDVPAFVRDAIAGMRAVMAGTAVDLGGVPLDEDGLDEFRRAVYAATREISPGTTRSYEEIARAIGASTTRRETSASP